MAHLAKVVPDVSWPKQSAGMKHASVVLLRPPLTTRTGEPEPTSEETERARFDSGGSGCLLRAGQVQFHVPEVVAWKARDVGSQDQDIDLQKLPGRFCKVGEISFQDQVPAHSGPSGVSLERLHRPSVHSPTAKGSC